MAKTRRSHGEGTLYFNEKRQRYEGQFSYIDAETGKSKRKLITGKTQKEVSAKGKLFLQSIENGLLPEANKLTVGEWLDRWLEDFIKPSVEVKTYEKYLSCMKNYIKPVLGEVLLTKLNVPDIQKLFNDLLATGGKNNKGISAVTVRNTRRYFISALDKAIKVGLLVKNAAKLTTPPKVRKEEIRPLNQEQANKLLETAKPESGDLYIAVFIALSTGMRIGEVMGLKWEDVNFDNKTVSVRRSRVTSNHGVIVKDTKTQTGRKIPIHTDLLKALQKHKKLQEWNKNLTGDKYLDQGWIIGGQFGNNYDPSYFYTKKFKPLIEKANINHETTFHDLRHTHATLLLIAGVNPKIVQERLGHAQIQITLDTYSHLLPDTQEIAVQAAEKFLAAQ